MKKQEIYRLAEKKWGKTFQMIMLAEECSELSHSILKAVRGKGMSDVADEIADVIIMIEQQYEMFEELENLVKFRKKFKLKRLEELIKTKNE